MNIAILGAGNIANVLACTMNKMDNVNLYAVASRDIEKAKHFAEGFNIPKYYGSYEEMLRDDNVELVYIATPHSHHFEHMKMCIEHNKNILCEKAFTRNASEAQQIINMAHNNNVYVAEAIWTRYMPSRAMINELLESGIIGKIHTMTANLSYVISQNERLIRPELAGGALLDVGIYCLNFAIMHFGKDIDRIESSVQMTDTGVDGQESITVFYRDGKMAVLTAGMFARSDRQGIIYGEDGYLVVDNINNPQLITVYNNEDCVILQRSVPPQISGYEYEIEAAIKCILEGKSENTYMPLSETKYMMELMDSIRKQWGMKYPGEELR